MPPREEARGSVAMKALWLETNEKRGREAVGLVVPQSPGEPDCE